MKRIRKLCRRAWRNYKTAQRDSKARLKRGDMLGVCKAIRRMDRWYLAWDSACWQLMGYPA
jgi:hypothetical protein